jgi:hypothetical protein
MKKLLILILLSNTAYAQDTVSTYNYNKQQRPNQGTPVYEASQCAGVVVMGVCQGQIIAPMPVATCYGQMLNGVCIGARL